MIVYLGLGANLGNREETINKALELLSEQVGPLIKRSSFFYSKPWGFDSPNDFCNICASFETTLPPSALLETTQSIERQLGRTKKSNLQQRSALTSNSEAASSASKVIYSDRSIDIDIILAFDSNGQELSFNFQFSPFDSLIVPHPLMQKRDFVMLPLQEIAPDLHYFTQK